jgi:hypothetical protein
MVKKKSVKKKRTRTYSSMRPKTGDLVYCHCVGDKYGWFMDRMGLVTELNLDDPDEFYTLYMLDNQKTVYINPTDFVETKVEIVSDYTSDQIEELKERRIKINKILEIDDAFKRG